MVEEPPPSSEGHSGAAAVRLSDAQVARVTSRERHRGGSRVDSSIPAIATTSESSGGAPRLALIAMAVAALAAVILSLGARADSPLTYELRGGTAEGGVVEARRGEVTVALSDGSSILAENRTRFSVDVVGHDSALMRLVSGKLHVRVEHNEDTHYRFIAGPYEVQVMGTDFDLAWDPEGDGLRLAMTKGEVRLLQTGKPPRTLRAGQVLALPAAPQPTHEAGAAESSTAPPSVSE